MLAMSASGPRLSPARGTKLVACTVMGDSDLLRLCTPASGMSRARGGGGGNSLERRQTAGDPNDDGIFSALDAAAELEGNRPDIPNQLGKCLSLGGVVRGMGFSASEVGRGILVRHR